MINLKNIWVVEFSISQKAFHLSTSDELIKNNIINVLRRKQNDYLVIGIFDNDRDADIYISDCYTKIKYYCMFNTWDGQTIVLK